MTRLSLVIQSTFILIIMISHGAKVEGFFLGTICDHFAKYPPRTNILEMLLNLAGVKDTTFYLYTNKHPNSVTIPDNSRRLRYLDFNPRRKTYILIHGFLGDHQAPWIKSLITRVLKKEYANIIVINWLNVFVKSKFNYGASAAKIERIGREIFTLLQKLSHAFATNLNDWAYVHILGHSIGAHMAGQVGRYLKSGGLFVHRITAFDPARPFFDKVGAHLRLHRSYARFVDVIHTNSHPVERTLGMYEPLGHMDFYPNGGDRQPQCSIRKAKTFTDGPASKCLSDLIFGIDGHGLYSNYMARKDRQNDDMICDHSIGQNYFILSLDRQFVARKMEFSNLQNPSNKCSVINCYQTTCVEMGFNAVKYNNPQYYGTYYVDVSYCK